MYTSVKLTMIEGGTTAVTPECPPAALSSLLPAPPPRPLCNPDLLSLWVRAHGLESPRNGGLEGAERVGLASPAQNDCSVACPCCRMRPALLCLAEYCRIGSSPELGAGGLLSFSYYQRLIFRKSLKGEPTGEHTLSPVCECTPPG